MGRLRWSVRSVTWHLRKNEDPNEAGVMGKGSVEHLLKQHSRHPPPHRPSSISLDLEQGTLSFTFQSLPPGCGQKLVGAGPTSCHCVGHPKVTPHQASGFFPDFFSPHRSICWSLILSRAWGGGAGSFPQNMDMIANNQGMEGAGWRPKGRGSRQCSHCHPGQLSSRARGSLHCSCPFPAVG